MRSARFAELANGCSGSIRSLSYWNEVPYLRTRYALFNWTMVLGPFPQFKQEQHFQAILKWHAVLIPGSAMSL